MIEAARADMTELPADRAERFAARARAERRQRRSCSRSAPSSATSSRPRSPPRRIRRRRRRSPTGSPSSWLARLDEGEDPAESRVTPRALAALVGLVAAKQISVGAGRQVLDRLVAEGGRAARDRRGRGARRDRRRGRARRRSSRRRWRPTPTPPSACAKATPRRSARSSATSCARPKAAPTAPRSHGSCTSSSGRESVGKMRTAPYVVLRRAYNHGDTGLAAAYHSEDPRSAHFGRRAKGKRRPPRQYAAHEPVSSQHKRFISSAVHPAARGNGRLGRMYR